MPAQDPAPTVGRMTSTRAQEHEAYSIPYAQSYENAVIHGTPESRLADTSFLNAIRSLAVGCPKCGAPAGRWCRRPDGRLFEVLHMDRFKARPLWGEFRVVSIQEDLDTPVLPRWPVQGLTEEER